MLIRFKTHGANSAIGSFTHGDVARVGDALAKHLIDIKVAEYAEKPALVVPKLTRKKGRK